MLRFLQKVASVIGGNYQFLLLLIATITTTEGYVVLVEPATEPFQLSEFLAGTFSTNTWNGSWISDDSFLYKNTDGDLIRFHAKNQSAEWFLNKSILEKYKGWSVTPSPDNRYLLVQYNVTSVFRHSTTSQFAIYDIENAIFYDIADKNQTQFAKWSPVGHNLIYVYKNNIYYVESPESADNPSAVTTNGIEGVIYNGAADWVYEEEVLESPSAVWFSPDGRHLAFATFNDTNVHEMSYFLYGEPGSLDDQYPTIATLRYPKVGTPNPIVSTHVATLDTAPLIKVTEIKGIADQFQPDDYVLYKVVWPSNDHVTVLATNRVQNRGELVRCSVLDEGDCTTEATYEETEGWLDVNTPIYSKDGTKRLEILSQADGDDFFDHLVLTDTENKTSKKLTHGRFVVTNIFGWDESNQLIYYGASVENDPAQQQVYSIHTETSAIVCLSCYIITPSGYCKYATAAFSKNLTYLANICQGPGPHYVQVQKSLDANEAVLWEDNQELLQRLALKSVPITKDYLVPVTDRFDARVRMFFPQDIDYSQKYPAIVNVYAGPNSNQIADAYSSGFHNYIVSNRKYIYILIDGRGSGRDGKSKLFQMYRKMGTVEIDDQLSVVKYLESICPFIDADNVGIWGWSYGGFATAWSLVKDKSNVFKFGLSVAPVTSFIYYDSIYTERYMGLPTEDDNLSGYNNTDVTRKVEDFRGKSFFLVHGNADDNVHYQQSMLLSKALERADVQFKQQSYPDENHSIGNLRPHLYHTIDRFFARSFNLPDPQLPEQHLINVNHL